MGAFLETGLLDPPPAALRLFPCAIELLVACGLCASNGEARRLIQQGGVAVNDQKVASIDVTFDQAQFAGDGVVIKKGKKVFHRAYTA